MTIETLVQRWGVGEAALRSAAVLSHSTLFGARFPSQVSRLHFDQWTIRTAAWTSHAGHSAPSTRTVDDHKAMHTIVALPADSSPSGTPALCPPAACVGATTCTTPSGSDDCAAGAGAAACTPTPLLHAPVVTSGHVFMHRPLLVGPGCAAVRRGSGQVRSMRAADPHLIARVKTAITTGVPCAAGCSPSVDPAVSVEIVIKLCGVTERIVLTKSAPFFLVGHERVVGDFAAICLAAGATVQYLAPADEGAQRYIAKDYSQFSVFLSTDLSTGATVVRLRSTALGRYPAVLRSSCGGIGGASSGSTAPRAGTPPGSPLPTTSAGCIDGDGLVSCVAPDGPREGKWTMMQVDVDVPWREGDVVKIQAFEMELCRVTVSGGGGAARWMRHSPEVAAALSGDVAPPRRRVRSLSDPELVVASPPFDALMS